MDPRSLSSKTGSINVRVPQGCRGNYVGRGLYEGLVQCLAQEVSTIVGSSLSCHLPGDSVSIKCGVQRVQQNEGLKIVILEIFYHFCSTFTLCSPLTRGLKKTSKPIHGFSPLGLVELIACLVIEFHEG